MVQIATHGNLFLEDTNGDGVFDIHSGDQVYDQDGFLLTTTKALETDSNLSDKYEFVDPDGQFLTSQLRVQGFGLGYTEGPTSQTTRLSGALLPIGIAAGAMVMLLKPWENDSDLDLDSADVHLVPLTIYASGEERVDDDDEVDASEEGPVEQAQATDEDTPNEDRILAALLREIEFLVAHYKRLAPGLSKDPGNSIKMIWFIDPNTLEIKIDGSSKVSEDDVQIEVKVSYSDVLEDYVFQFTMDSEFSQNAQGSESFVKMRGILAKFNLMTYERIVAFLKADTSNLDDRPTYEGEDHAIDGLQLFDDTGGDETMVDPEVAMGDFVGELLANRGSAPDRGAADDKVAEVATLFDAVRNASTKGEAQMAYDRLEQLAREKGEHQEAAVEALIELAQFDALMPKVRDMILSDHEYKEAYLYLLKLMIEPYLNAKEDQK